ncbi:MAG: hypothetical protein K0R78_2414 [Pelosinus sp.]|jgi:hypothetical protein|nr:hypothetical protein [Pelosinus sp.]
MSGGMTVKCVVCGLETQSDEHLCPRCIELENKVQVLTPEEKRDFAGITIEQDQEKQTEYGDNRSYTDNHRIYVKHMNVNMGQTSILTKIILGIIFAGLLIVALPIALIIISIVMFFLFFMRR